MTEEAGHETTVSFELERGFGWWLFLIAVALVVPQIVAGQ
jgi:hypothetical protein